MNHHQIQMKSGRKKNGRVIESVIGGFLFHFLEIDFYVEHPRYGLRREGKMGY
jgi:hypothetical protein